MQASSLPAGPRPGGALCVLRPPGEGQRGAWRVSPLTAYLPGALVTACASICHPRGRASCIIQAPWRGPSKRALARADWPDQMSRHRTLDELDTCPSAPSMLRCRAGGSVGGLLPGPGVCVALGHGHVITGCSGVGDGGLTLASLLSCHVASVGSRRPQSSGLSFLIREMHAGSTCLLGAGG